MPHTDPVDNKLYQDLYYRENKKKILEYKQNKYITREALILENIKLNEQINDLNARLLTAIENKRYFKPKSEVENLEINTGSFTIDFN